MKSNKFWLAVLGGVVVLSVAATLLIGNTPAVLARIYRHSELVNEIDLTSVPEPYSIALGTKGGGFNLVSIEPGRIRISEADCPDGSCVRQGWLSSGLMPIVCLPNSLVIRLEGGVGNDIDAIVG